MTSSICTKFCTLLSSFSQKMYGPKVLNILPFRFFNYFSLIFKKGTGKWLNCTYLKYELNRSYNGGGVVYPLKSEASRSTLQ